MRVLGYDWQPQSLGRIAGYRAALSAIRTENAEWVRPVRAIPIQFERSSSKESNPPRKCPKELVKIEPTKKVSVRTVVTGQGP